MNIDKSVFGVLSILVAVIVVATVAIPVIEDSSKEIKTLKNNTTEAFFVSESDDEPIVITADNVGNYTINGEPFTKSTLIALNEGFTIRYSGTNLQIRNLKDTTYNYDESPSLASQSVTIHNGVLTTGSGKSFSYTGPVLYKSENGTYGQTVYGQEYYIDNDATIYTDIGLNFGTDNYLALMIMKGTWQDMKVTAASNNESGTVTVLDPADFTVSLQGITQDTAISGLAKNTRIDATFDNGVESQSGTASQTRYLWAPIEYHTITNNDSTMISILQIVPLLLLIVPVMMAVRMYSSRGE